MHLTNTLRASKLAKLLKAQANSPWLGKPIRWTARKLRKLDQQAVRLSAKNRAHDKKQAELLESYRNGQL